jgi:hypothetical protein
MHLPEPRFDRLRTDPRLEELMESLRETIERLLATLT